MSLKSLWFSISSYTNLDKIRCIFFEFKRVVVSHLLTHKDSAPEEPDDAKVDDIDSEEE